jgi:hypothetical protein
MIQKMSRRAFRHLDTSLHRLHQSFFKKSREHYVYPGLFAYLKHHLIDFVQVAIFDAQLIKNEIPWPLTP